MLCMLYFYRCALFVCLGGVVCVVWRSLSVCVQANDSNGYIAYGTGNFDGQVCSKNAQCVVSMNLCVVRMSRRSGRKFFPF